MGVNRAATTSTAKVQSVLGFGVSLGIGVLQRFALLDGLQFGERTKQHDSACDFPRHRAIHPELAPVRHLVSTTHSALDLDSDSVLHHSSVFSGCGGGD